MPCCGYIEYHFPNIEKHISYRERKEETSHELGSSVPEQPREQRQSGPHAATARVVWPVSESQIPFHLAQQAQQRAHVHPGQPGSMAPSWSTSHGPEFHQLYNHANPFMAPPQPMYSAHDRAFPPDELTGPPIIRRARPNPRTFGLRPPYGPASNRLQNYANPLMAPSRPFNRAHNRPMSTGDLPEPHGTGFQPGRGGNSYRHEQRGERRGGRRSQPG